MRRRTKNNKKTPAERARDLFSLLKALILIGILCGIPAYILLCHREVLSNLNSLHDVLTLFRSHSEQSAVLYLGAQILQIVISVLPGQIFQIAAGYIFGFLPGLLLSLIGAAAGTTVTYFLAYIIRKTGERAERRESIPDRISALPDPGDAEGSLLLCGRGF